MRETPSGRPSILQVLCMPRDKGVNPEQDTTNTRLIPYLYERSEWIKDVFTFVRPIQGSAMELEFGDYSELFAREEIIRFRAELSKVPPPGEGHLRMEYDNLAAILKLALEDRNLSLVLSIG